MTVTVLSLSLLLSAGLLVVAVFDIWQARRVVREVIEYANEHDPRQDLRARQVLERSMKTGAPFALYLRGFELESAEFMKAPNGPVNFTNGEVAAAFGVVNTGVETLLRRVLTRDVPAITLGNPVDFTFLLESKQIPRLWIDGVDWREVVAELVRCAAIIVIHVHHLTPGVADEFKMVLGRGRQLSTLIVLSRGEQCFTNVARSTGYIVPQYDEAAIQDALSAFPTVITESALLAGEKMWPTTVSRIVAKAKDWTTPSDMRSFWR